MFRKWTVVVTLAFVCLPLAAEDTCPPTDTIAECWQRFFDGPETGKSATESGTKSALVAKGTGVQAFDSVLGTVLTDFIPLFTVSAETGDLGEDQEVLTLDFNLDVLGLDDPNLKLQLQLREAKLFDPINMALPDATRVGELEDTFDDFDDVTLLLAWNATNAKTGRSFARYSAIYDTLFTAVQARARARVDMSALDEGLFKLLSMVGRLLPDATDAEGLALNSLPDDQRAVLTRQIVQTAKRESALERSIVEEAETTRFFRFADLINNQPQLSVSAMYRVRDELAGPDELSVRVRYERGIVNVNSFRKSCKEQGLTDDLLTCLERYLASHEKLTNQANRVSFSLDYTDTDDYSIDLPADMVMLDLEFERKLSASFGYGRYLRTDERGNELSRVDFSASYEDFGDDPMRRDRAIATATYTQKINDSTAAVFGLSWANKAEFLPEDDDRLSANIGLSYKLVSNKDK